MLSSDRVPDDERKGRRLGDETKNRIADLAAGWTVDADSLPDPEPREPDGRDGLDEPRRAGRETPRRKAKTLPPPPPGSSARKALEDKIVELREVLDPPEGAKPPAAGRPAGPPALPPARPGTPRVGPPTGQAPVAPRPRAPLTRDPLDLSAIPESDKTKENRGAVAGSLTTNETSGTIGGDTPPPIFDRAAIARGQQGALASERLRDCSGPVRTDAQLTEPAAGGARDRSGPVRGARLAEPAAEGSRDRSGPVRAGARLTEPAAEGSGGRAGAPTRPLEGVRSTGGGPVAGRPRGDAASGAELGSGAARGTPGPLGSRLPLPAEPAAPLPKDPPDLPPPPVGALPRVIADDSIQETIPELGPAVPPPPLAVPIGEFDHGQTILEQDKLRIAYTQSTIKRDAASALLGLAEPALTVVKAPAIDVLLEETAVRMRGDATTNDWSASSTGRFERGDPTLGDERGDATTVSATPSRGTPAGTLRSTAALRRKRGLAGDVRYVPTVVFGVRRVKRELAELEARQATRQQSRRHHLVTLGRTAVTSAFDHPALGPAREQLTAVEDERSQHAGHVAAADAELIRVRREREASAKQYLVDRAALDAELAALGKQLEPLDKEAAGIKKRAAVLRDSLAKIDHKIADTEASLVSVKGGKLDRAGIQAELATLRADRKTIQADEPVLAGELDALNPRIAAVEAARGEAVRKRADLERAEQDDQRRAEELLAAIGAKRKVVDRATADAEVLRDKILFQLAERLYVDRPDDLTPQLAPIDEIDLELASADRRAMELREILASIDRWKVARGLAMIVVVLAALGALTGWLLYHFL